MRMKEFAVVTGMLLTFVGALLVAQDHIGALQSTGPVPVIAESPICWAAEAGQQCVPLSIIRATFKGWQAGGAPPVNQVRQDLIAAQAQMSDALRNFRQCEAALGPLQAQQHQTALQQAQQQLNDDNAKAAPLGQVWNPKVARYEPAPTAAKKGNQ